MTEIDRLTQSILEDYREELRLLLHWQTGSHARILALLAHIRETEQELLPHVGSKEEVSKIGKNCYNTALTETMPAVLRVWLRKG